MLRYFSVCSGIEAATCAWHPLGWAPVAFCEIEPFPAAVLKHHYPNVPNLGDMTKINGGDYAGRVDVLVGGTPCQAFSVAGLRRGLVDPRGSLTLTFAQLADDMAVPFVVWENVPGVLSSKDNAFGCLLGLLAGEADALVAPGGKWTDAGFVLGPQRTVAWRVLDAQYFGLAQRRRRVFVVACPRNGADPREILFELEGVRRDSPPSREAGQSTAAHADGGSHWSGGPHPALNQSAKSSGGVGCSNQELFSQQGAYLVPGQQLYSIMPQNSGKDYKARPVDVAQPLMAGGPVGGNQGGDVLCVTGQITHALKAEGADASEDGTGRGNPIVAQTIAVNEVVGSLCAESGPNTHGCRGVSGTQTLLSGYIQPVVGALRANAGPNTHGQSGMACQQSVEAGHILPVCFGCNNTAGPIDVATARNAHSSPQGRLDFESETFAVSLALRGREGGATAELGGGVAHALRSSSGGGDKPHVLAFPARMGGTQCAGAENICPSMGAKNPTAVATSMQVRRLTPIECSRLQGFPDDYLELKYANAEEAHSAQILHELWENAGAFAREGWRPGVAASLLSPEILLTGVYVGWISWSLAAECAATRRALQGQKPWPEKFVRALRENARTGPSPYRRESFEQCARELGRPVQELPYERAQAQANLLRAELWEAAQRTWPLRYALATPSQVASEKMNPDGPRYKALGNSMAVPCMAWIGRRIQKVVGHE